ncbi:MAG: HAMP domain-containing histidine kinase [Lachnospiraceae bacterium]|nr:HAMP domain-containing histidine kinase [Lachnospiraceae bacterium]
MAMDYVLILCGAAGMLYFAVRLLILKKSIKSAKQQLMEINGQMGENREMMLLAPDKELEELLEEINRSLKKIRQERIGYARRETEFKQQIENISHDLRTPLTSMLGYLKLMDKTGFGEEEQEDLQRVLRKAEQLQELITQFYDYSRATAKEYLLDPECVEITRMLREALADSYGELSEKQLEVEAELPDTPVYVAGNQQALKRVIQNLLQNSVKYAVDFLKVSIRKEEDRIEVCFLNAVEEMTEQEAERLFDRFYTRDFSRGDGSAGLGLTIAREFMEKMGGSIRAELTDGTLKISLLFQSWH